MKYANIVIFICVVLFGFFLRVIQADTNPPGLYIDEVSIGINAYDILHTGKDQFGVKYPLTFAAFGEQKMPVYIYLVSGAMYVFGKTELAVRLPSVLAGSLTIGIVFLLFQELLRLEIKKKKTTVILSILGALLLATSSWHLQFSRAGFEATVALFFYSSALLWFVYFWKKKHILYFVFADIFLLMTFYTYDGYRLLVPLTALVTIIIFLKSTRKKLGVILTTVGLFFASLPLVLFTFTQSGLTRISETSAFTAYHFPAIWQQMLADIVVFVENYLSFFSMTFLFSLGDQINRHQVQGFGLLYLWQLPYIIFGLIALTKSKTKFVGYSILSLLLAAPLTAALAVPSPHSLRFLVAVVPFIFLTIVGIWRVSQLLQKKKTIRVIIFTITLLFALMQFGYYLDYYYVHYSKTALMDWGGSCKQVAQKVVTIHKQYNVIYVDHNLLCVSEYFLFYSPNVTVQIISFNQLPQIAKDQRVLFIKPKNKMTPHGQVVDNVYLLNLNKDVFAEFWKL